MEKLLIATTNPGKVAELKEFLKDIPLKLVSLADLHISQKAPEDGVTFQENAIAKAQFYSKLTGFPALGDDGGFEIDALGGEPGVKSHRWIHQDREDTDDELISYTMQKMKDVPLPQRGAQLRLVLALVFPDGSVYTAEESVRGIVAEKPLTNYTPGYPYRALLYFPEIKKYYHSDFTQEELEKYNHRRRAVERLKPEIKKAFHV